VQIAMIASRATEVRDSAPKNSFPSSFTHPPWRDSISFDCN